VTGRGGRGGRRARLVETERPTAPLRTCVGCRRTGERSDLLRLVVADVGGVPTVVADLRRVLPGRGAWLHPDPSCWELAQRRRALLRALPAGEGVDQVGISDAVSALHRRSPEHDPAPEPGSGHPTSPSPSAMARETGSGSER
jgi:predicted RNA-binding protein YlxR (DUF448 family)